MQDTLGTKTADTHRLPLRLHHNAWVVKDQERTRAFYEDVLGFKLTAFWIEVAPLMGKMTTLSHAFYALEDGSALAFFCMAEEVDHEKFQSPKTELFNHVAVSVDSQTQARLHAGLVAAEYPNFSIEHGYCTSLYAVDPDGLRLEFVLDAPDAARIDQEQRRDARDWLNRWNNGERNSNNQLYTKGHRTAVPGEH
jgi:glyoxylase I family protein